MVIVNKFVTNFNNFKHFNYWLLNWF